MKRKLHVELDITQSHILYTEYNLQLFLVCVKMVLDSSLDSVAKSEYPELMKNKLSVLDKFKLSFKHLRTNLTKLLDT